LENFLRHYDEKNTTNSLLNVRNKIWVLRKLFCTAEARSAWRRLGLPSKSETLMSAKGEAHCVRGFPPSGESLQVYVLRASFSTSWQRLLQKNDFKCNIYIPMMENYRVTKSKLKYKRITFNQMNYVNS